MARYTPEERSALFVATLTAFLGPFMISSVNVALPAIERDLALNAVQLSWISTAYLLATAVVLVPAGKVADIYGRKKIFSLGLVAYTLASTLAIFAPSGAWLIGLRAFQGAGAALTVTTGMAILTSVFAPQRRGQAIGIYVAAVYIGLSAGPFAGGLMTQHLGWRSLFVVMLPLGLGAIWITRRCLEGEWADAAGERLDRIGSVLYGAAVLALVYGASRLPAVWAWVLLVGAAVGLAGFIWYERRIPQPVFDLSLFWSNRVFAFSSMAALIHYAATFAVTFLVSLYLQYIKGLQPQAAGTLLVLQPVVMAVFSPLAGRLSDRIEPRIVASAGMLLTAVGLACFARVDPETSLIVIAVNLMGLGFGFALFSSPNMSAIMGAVQPRQYGIASGAVATMRLIGQMASMAAATVVLSLYLGTQAIGDGNHPLFLRSMQTLCVCFAALSCVGIGFSMFRGNVRA